MSTSSKELLRVRIENDFKYHAPNTEQIDQYRVIRESGKSLALILVDQCPLGRELSTALTYIEMAVMQANAAIARSGI